MKTLSFDPIRADVAITEKEKSAALHANALLHNGQGAGNDFLGWVGLPSALGEEELQAIETEAARLRGNTGEKLFQLLESRLDNVVYRLGFAKTRRDARQLVSHNHFTVNGKRVNIPSYQVKAGDVIEVIESSRSSVKFSKLLGEEAPVVLLPSWLERDKNALKGTVTKLPVREDIDVPIAEHLIVELYSK